MKYIFLAIVLLCVSILVYINYFHQKSLKEGLSYEEQAANLVNQEKYYDYRKFPQVVKNNNDDSKFVDLNLDKTRLIDKIPSANVQDSEISKKIEKCRIIDKNKDCSLISENDCGYCWHTDKIQYGDANGPAADVCPKGGWVAPGPNAAFNCQKKKEQALCNTMTDCGDAVGEKSICGWCPLNNKGVPKKQSPDGKGWVAKYSEDKCDWKSKIQDILGDTKGFEKCTDLKTKLPSQFGASRKWHDRDGKYYDCERYGQGNNCRYWGNSYVYQGLTGNQACCVCGGGEKGLDFPGNLIEPNMCAKFKQMFPCVGPNMFTGPHTPQCLSSLWKKSGCTGDLNQRITDQSDYNWWNSHSYGDAVNNMKSFSKTSKESSNYNEANTANNKCYGKNVDPCEDRFKPRPLECSKKIYNQTGMSSQGKLNPENTNSWPDGFVPQGWKQGQNQTWSVSEFFKKLLGYKQQNVRDSINPKANFDRYMYNNQLVSGVYPEIPWEKPCWKDFVRMMTATEYIKLLDNGNLSFSSNSSGVFKGILPKQDSLQSKQGVKKNMYWVGNYELKKEIYDMKYFPFWNFVKANKTIWNSRWGSFKTLMLKSSYVKASGHKTNAKWFGWSPSQAYNGTLQKGEGDCDRDRDCAKGLKCAHDRMQIPGVRNTGAIKWGRDFCYDPNDNVLDGTDALTFMNGSNFDRIIETKSSLSEANREGVYYRAGNNRLLTKAAYMHENFPYWTFIRYANRS